MDRILKNCPKNKERINELEKINIEIEHKKKLKETKEKKISKLQQCKDEHIIELDLRAKRIFNIIKLTCRNIFEKGAKDFLESYKNLRDYQKVFRLLTERGGEIQIKDDIMYVKLDSMGRKGFKKKCKEFFRQFNDKKIKTIDGKYILHFELSN